MGFVQKRLTTWLIGTLLVIILASCASTASPPLEGKAADLARDMRQRGAPLTNIRNVPQAGRRAEKLTDIKGFDIPGVDLGKTPAGIIRIYKDAKEAEFDAQLPKLLGGPGIETKQPFTANNGVAELEIDYRIEPKVADVYLNAFRAAPVAGSTP